MKIAKLTPSRSRRRSPRPTSGRCRTGLPRHHLQSAGRRGRGSADERRDRRGGRARRAGMPAPAGRRGQGQRRRRRRLRRGARRADRARPRLLPHRHAVGDALGARRGAAAVRARSSPPRRRLRHAALAAPEVRWRTAAAHPDRWSSSPMPDPRGGDRRRRRRRPGVAASLLRAALAWTSRSSIPPTSTTTSRAGPWSAPASSTGAAPARTMASVMPAGVRWIKAVVPPSSPSATRSSSTAAGW